MLLRSRMQQQFIHFSGIFLVITGTILLSAGIAYFAYAYKARSDLDKLNVSVARPLPSTAIGTTPAILAPAVVPQGSLDLTASLQAGRAMELFLPAAPVIISGTVFEPAQVGIGTPILPTLLEDAFPAGLVISPPRPLAVEESPLRAEPAAVVVEPIPIEVGPVPLIVSPPAPPAEAGPPPAAAIAPLAEPAPPQISASAIASQQLYPGEAMKASYWSNPLEYEPPSYIESSIVQSFRPVDARNGALPGTLPAPTHITVPSIGVNSDVAGLRIVNLGDSRAYETPKHIVGHIPQSNNPGESGSVWLFGHLESPILGEGNVFYSLPQIPDLLRKGQDVYTIVESGETSYLYKITEAFVVDQDQLKLDYAYLKELKPQYAHLDPGNANIHLVACVPRFVYDSRLVVSGELVGIRS